MTRLDKRGRRIGYNWWREFIMEQYHPARTQWLIDFESGANDTYRPGILAEARRKERRGGRREVTDFIKQHPPPTLRQFLEEFKGMKDQAT